MVQKIVTIIAQVVTCLILLSVTFIAIPVGNGWEIPFLAAFFTLGICLVGWGVAKLFRAEFSLSVREIVIILICSGLGTTIFLIPGIFGFWLYLLPAAGAILGYQYLK
ncbi:MAG: hypothetical protein AAF902_14315 [Chloroflexota bacterium]